VIPGRESRRDVAWVFLAALVVFALALPGRGLWHNDEHRYAEVAREMTTPGADLVVPHLNGGVYSDKPPLVFWMTALLHGALGVSLPLAARIPSILAAAGTVVASFAIARRLYGRTAAFATAAVLATTSEFWWLGVRANLDSVAAFFTTLGVALFVRAEFPGTDERPRRALLAALAFLAVGVGSLAKSPATLALPAFAALVVLVAEKRFRSLTAFAWGVPLALLPLALWLAAAWVRAGPGYVEAITLGQWVKHPAGEVDKAKPFWFYLEALPLAAAPWTLLLPAALYTLVAWRRPAERRADRFLVVWGLAQLVLLSLSKAKRDLYLTPVMPAVALLVGRLARDAIEDPAVAGHALVATSARALAALGALAGTALAAGGAVALVDGGTLPFVAWARVPAGVAVVAVILGAGIVVATIAALRNSDAGRGARALAAGVVLAVVAAGVVVLPTLDPQRNAAPFVEKVAPTIGDAPVADYGGVDFVANWVLRRDVVPRIEDAPGRDVRLRRANAFVHAAGAGHVFLLVDRGFLDRNGMPDGMAVALTWPRVLDDDLLLLAHARQ
jgi:4-amino-4-deoxy-L-arabinose transferase-like glycosyltransferase